MSGEECSNVGTTRRAVLASLGGGFVVGLGIGSARGDSGGSSSGPSPSDFHVEGRQWIRTEVTPDAIVRQKRKTSPALERRYGSATIEATERIDRPAPGRDRFPTRTTVTVSRPWTTQYATADEWKTLFTARDSRESDYPFGVWEYDQVDGGYEKVAPMNVVSPATTSGVSRVLVEDGWTTRVIDYTRWAWNSDTERFEEQHESVATSVDGASGRKHARLWEFGGYVSASAHVDSEFPHEAIAFEDAEQAIGDAFADALGWTRDDDYYDLENGGFGLDHDGSATRVAEV